MKNRFIITLFIMILFSHNQCTTAQVIKLPEPNKSGGKPLMEVLENRSSARDFSSTDLTIQQLSDLLWAAWGINRKEEGKRTAPSSRNNQEIDLYVAMKTGLYIYDAADNILNQIHKRDIRSITGTQDFVGDAPVNIIMVADMEKRGVTGDDEITDSDLLSSYANSGYISQNIYLYCASEGLISVARAMIDRPLLSTEMELNENQVIILAHTVGFKQKQDSGMP